MPLLEKRTKKYLPLKERLLSIQSNHFSKTDSFTESTSFDEMLCVYGKGCRESKRKKVFFLSENSIFLIA